MSGVSIHSMAGLYRELRLVVIAAWQFGGAKINCIRQWQAERAVTFIMLNMVGFEYALI